MKRRQVVLLNESTKNIPFAELTKVAQVAQIQVDRDWWALANLKIRVR